MGHLGTIRVAFALCLLTSLVFLSLKMLYKFDTVNTSSRMRPQTMNIQQFQRVFERKTATSTAAVQAKIASETGGLGSVTVTRKSSKTPTRETQNVRGPPEATEATVSGKDALTKSGSVTVVPTRSQASPPQNCSSQSGETRAELSRRTGNGTQPTPTATPRRGVGGPKTAAAPPGLGPSEQRFLARTERFLQEKRPSRPLRDALVDSINRAKSRTPDWTLHERESLQDSQSLNYLKCPTSVRHKMLTTPFARRKFTLDTPILAWDEHYTHDEYLRLLKFHEIFGWQGVNESDIASSLTKLDSPHNRYLFDNRFVNGKIPDDDKCITCAVIGNGGILNGSKKGKEIDANDYVFRVNTALTSGYEEDVGTRTSFYCFGMITLSNTLARGWTTDFKQLPNDKGIRYVFFADHPWAYTYLASVLNGGKGTVLGNRYPVRFPKMLQASDVKLVHPDFERYLKWSWVNSTNQRAPIHRPTTGGIMLLLALHTCDEVNVYGFGGSYTKFSEHYYDKSYEKHISYANHDNAAENRLWKELHSLGIIKMYTRG